MEDPTKSVACTKLVPSDASSTEGAVSMRILVVDDQKRNAEMLRQMLTTWGHAVEAVTNGSDALTLLREGHPFDLVITDLAMPEMTGLQLLAEIKMFDSSMAVMLLTAFGTVQTAVDAMRKGAYDYLEKPINFDELHIILERLHRTRKLTKEVEDLRLELHKEYRGGVRAIMVGSCPAMRRIAQVVQQVSQGKATILIQGESGTGKELIARAIHYSGVTANGPFIAVNCGRVSRSLLESQLFGHVKGAFTDARANTKGYFRSAHEGTLLLDEITEMDPEIQVKLLRVLQEHEVVPVGATEPIPVDLRIIATTNRTLSEALQEGRLRDDLYYRLSVVNIVLPPLRERKSDIPELVQYLNTRFSHQFGVAPKLISAETMEGLIEYDWPGNIRELENVLTSAFALAEDEVRLPEDFLHRQPGMEELVLTDSQPGEDIVFGDDGEILISDKLGVILRNMALARTNGEIFKSSDMLCKLRELSNNLTRALESAEYRARSSDCRTKGRVRMKRSPTFTRRSGCITIEGEGQLPTWGEVERMLLAEAMMRAGKIKRRAAEILRLEPRRLSRLLKKHGLE